MEHAVEVPVLVEIPREECLRLLRTHGVGRFAAARPGGAPLVVPVNYLLDGDVVVFRSGRGSKLNALFGRPVSFQVDQIDPFRHTGWSVLVTGWGYEASHWETSHLELVTWAPGERGHWVRIVPEAVTGRRIQFPDLFVDPRGYL